MGDRHPSRCNSGPFSEQGRSRFIRNASSLGNSESGCAIGYDHRVLQPLAPGKSAEVPLSFTVSDPTREIVKVFAVIGHTSLPVEIPTFPPTGNATDFRIADGVSLSVYQHAVEKQMLTLGIGNGDGQANPGERIAILLPDGDAYRAAELFTNDPCVDLTTRISDSWEDYDHVGASAKYSLPLIRTSCASGHVIRMLARVRLPNKPNHKVRYAVIEFKVH